MPDPSAASDLETGSETPTTRKVGRPRGRTDRVPRPSADHPTIQAHEVMAEPLSASTAMESLLIHAQQMASVLNGIARSKRVPVSLRTKAAEVVMKTGASLIRKPPAVRQAGESEAPAAGVSPADPVETLRADALESTDAQTLLAILQEAEAPPPVEGKAPTNPTAPEDEWPEGSLDRSPGDGPLIHLTAADVPPSLRRPPDPRPSKKNSTEQKILNVLGRQGRVPISQLKHRVEILLDGHRKGGVPADLEVALANLTRQGKIEKDVGKKGGVAYQLSEKSGGQG